MSSKNNDQGNNSSTIVPTEQENKSTAPFDKGNDSQINVKQTVNVSHPKPPSVNKNGPRVLFICKQRNHSYGPSFGLINSCKFICNALNQYGIVAEVVSVIDNNCIDKEVTKFKPTHCFIEALWVVPEKFKQLIPLHPKVKWYVRIHSKIPFLSHEGMAMHWLREYNEISKNSKYHTLHISANNIEPIEVFKSAYGIKIYYHPNIYYPPQYPKSTINDSRKDSIIDIGCFGAIRPMKNQLLQSLAAISFGNQLKKTIKFHINSDRIEQKGDPILKNLEYAFKDTNHELVKHPWMDHDKFINVVRSMDIGMQVSFSETFNIVTADFVYNDIPVIGSDEIEWMSHIYKANPNDSKNMIDRLYVSWYGRSVGLQKLNKWKLNEYNCEATLIWLNSLK